MVNILYFIIELKFACGGQAPCGMWNEVRNTAKFSTISDFSASLSLVKTWLRDLLYQRQMLGDQEEWSDENFLLT